MRDYAKRELLSPLSRAFRGTGGPERREIYTRLWTIMQPRFRFTRAKNRDPDGNDNAYLLQRELYKLQIC